MIKKKYQETSRLPGGVKLRVRVLFLDFKVEICLWDFRETFDWL